jgi:hypothetical protein
VGCMNTSVPEAVLSNGFFDSGKPQESGDSVAPEAEHAICSTLPHGPLVFGESLLNNPHNLHVS